MDLRKIILLTATCLFSVSAHAERVMVFTIYLNGDWGHWSTPELACERYATSRWSGGGYELLSYSAYPYGSSAMWPNACEIKYRYNAGTITTRRTDFIYTGYRCDATSHWSDAQQRCLSQRPYDPVEAKNRGKPPLCGVGNPINPGTGNKYQQQTDMTAALPGGIAFTRYYNSQSSHIGPLGPNWRHSYSARILVDDGDRYQVQRPGGKVYLFIEQAGVLSSDADVTDRLERTEDGWRYTRSDNTVEHYNSAGRLVSITDARGLNLSLSYHGSDAQDRALLESVRDAYGYTLNFSYDAHGRIHTLTDPQGGEYRYGYGDFGNLSSVTYPDGRSRAYHYEDSAHVHALTGITDERGTRFATWAYDAQGRAIMSEHAGGAERVDLLYNAEGTTTVTDALGASRTYAFENHHGVIKPATISGDPCTACPGQAQRYSYDANGFLASKTDRNGYQTIYVNNARGLQVSRTEAAGTPQARTITTQWHPEFRQPVLITEPGKTTTLDYDAQSRLLSRTETDASRGAARRWTYTYTAVGRLASVDGPRTDLSDVTHYQYDTQGQLTRILNALGQVTEIATRDGHGRPLTLIDANAVTTTLAYDARGRLRSRTLGSGAQAARTEFDYDPVGQLTRLTLPTGTTIDYRYDAAQRLIQISDRLGNRIEYTLDALGHRQAETVYDAGGSLRRSRAWVYDRLGRMIQALGAAAPGTGYGYDANGNQTAITDALGRVITQAFDALDRLIWVSDPLGGVTRYDYDAQDRLVSVTDPRGLSTTYRYDGLGNRLEQASPDTGLSMYTYDDAGNRLTQTDARGITTGYRYDALNRRIAVHYPDSSLDVAYGYDQGHYGIGRLSSMRDASGTTEYGYDARGNLIEALSLIQGSAYTTQYRYDRADQLIQIRYPSGRRVDYVRNTAGQIRTVSTTANQLSEMLADAIDYSPFGGLDALRYGNGLSAAYRYDLDGRLSALTTTSIRAHEYAYDPVGNLTTITDTLDPAGHQAFGYDALDRLIGEAGPYGRRDYTYDALGNRTQRIKQDLRLDKQGRPITRTQDYVYGEQSHQLVRINRRELSYDEAGNLRADRGARRAFGYDDSGRLSTFTRRGLRKAAYRYDGQGRRIIKLRHTAKGQQRTHFHYAPDGRLLAETVYNRRGLKKIVREYLWLDNTPLAQIRTRYRNNGTIKNVQQVFLLSDHLNTPRLATDENQRVVWRWASDAFGQGGVDRDPDRDGRKVNVRLRFPGQYQDAESGLHYNYFRDYDPNTGRYIESDPIGLKGGLNTYAYVGNNPVLFLDPRGLVYSPAEHGMPYSLTPMTGTASVGGGGSFHLGPFGGITTAGRTYGADGQLCEFVTVCLRTGWGYYAAVHGGFSFGANSGGSTDAGGWSFGAGYDVAVGVGGGSSAAISPSGASKNGPSANIGIGGSIGLDVCYTEIFNCQCSLH